MLVDGQYAWLLCLPLPRNPVTMVTGVFLLPLGETLSGALSANCDASC
jgi:hypothetical protein